MRNWARRRIVVTLSVGLVSLWVLVCGWLVLDARSDVASGARELRAVRRDASIATLVDPTARSGLDRAGRHFDDADHNLSSPVLAPLRILPVVGRHVRAADRLVEGASVGTAAAADALDDLDDLADRPTDDGPARVQTLRDLAATAGQAQEALARLDPGSPESLFAPLGDAIAELATQRDDAARAAGSLERTSLALASLLDGPDPYLVLGANNAEMRNGSGMFLSAAELAFSQGDLAMGDVRPTADLVLRAGAVAAEGDLARNWPWLEPGRDFRQLGLTADFPQSAQLAARTWAEVPGASDVGGVISIDVDGLRSLLRVVGPVEVDGVEYTSDTVRGELLRQQYQRFGDDQDVRRDQVGEVARAVFDRLEAGEWELADLATELADAVQGRHLLIWSSDPALQKTWADVGADGHLDERSVSIGLINRSANKLDSWIETEADLVSVPGGDGDRRVTITYVVRNEADGSGPAYVAGPNIDGLEAGDHRALVVVNLPAGSTQVVLEGGRTFLAGGDGPTVVVGAEVTVAAGAQVTVTVTARLPANLSAIVIEPSARIPRARWTVDGTEIERDRRRVVALAGE